jgi:CheY-like chemotaxis protein
VATILIVDDYPTMRFLLRSILNSEGHLTLEAPHGQAALEQLAARPDVALLVTDLEMPVMDGLELLRALRLRPTLPKLVVSGCAPVPPLADLGVSEFFSKPLDLARFKRTVRLLLSGPATLNV